MLESRIRDADWDAEVARVSGNTGALLDAIATAEELRAQRERLSDPAWLKALETEM